MNKRIVRPRHGRMLYGVAAGLANYFEIDPVIMRIIFILLIFWGGLGLILYLIFVFIIPDENGQSSDSTQKTSTQAKKNSTIEKIIGLTITFTGTTLLLQNIYPNLSLDKTWPVVPIFLGIVLIIAGFRRALSWQ